MTYSASENICRQSDYDLQYGRQFTVATERYLRAWMAKHTCREIIYDYAAIRGRPDKGRNVLYYVIQVVTGTEDKVEEQVKVMVGNELYHSCFHPMRQMRKNSGGMEGRP